ncbi:MAG: hypothetical protein ACN4GF_02100 [Lentimonas sp.]
MKNLIVSLFLIAISFSLNAQSVFENFDTYVNSDDLRTEWSSFSEVLNGGIYLKTQDGRAGSQAAIYVADWSRGNFFGARYLQDGANLFGNTSVSIYVNLVPNSQNDARPVESTEFSLGIEGLNGDIWLSTEKQTITESGFNRYDFEMSESAMFKETNITGTETLAQALASVEYVRFLFTNDSSLGGHEDVLLDDLSIIPESSTYGILMGLLSLSLISIKRRIR